MPGRRRGPLCWEAVGLPAAVHAHVHPSTVNKGHETPGDGGGLGLEGQGWRLMEPFCTLEVCPSLHVTSAARKLPDVYIQELDTCETGD